MSIKVLIVDDDRIELNDFIDSMDWNALGFEVVGTAINGMIGFQQYIKLEPDIVITDIEMPGMSGIELAKKIRENDDRTKIVFLTSHEKFEYVYSGIKLEISDYFLKQGHDPQETSQKLQKLKQSIVEANIRKLEEEERVILQMMKHPVEMKLDSDVYLKLSKKQFCMLAVFEESPLPFFYPFMNKSVTEKQNGFLNMRYIVKQKYPFFMLPLTFEGFILFIENNEENQFASQPKRLDLLCLDLLELLNTSFHTSFYIVKVCYNNSIQEIKAIYQQMVENFMRRYFFPPSSILDMSDLQGTDHSIPVVEEEVLRKMEKNMEFQQLEAYLDPFFNRILLEKSYKAFVENMNVLCYHLLQRLEQLNKIEENPSAKLWDETKLMSISSVHAAFQFVKEEYRAYYHGLKQKYNYSDYVKNAILFIQQNYKSDEMTVEDIANSIPLSAARLRTIFKNETGKTVHQYITDIRMDKAKQLLLDSKKWKLDQISKKVGYLNGKYLSRVFKREIGVTPEEFRLRRHS